MSGNGNQVPLAPSQRGPGPYPRAPTPHRGAECYHPPGGAATGYMPSGTPTGAPASTQPTMRVQPTPQQTAPQQQQQDLNKPAMPTHNFVPNQNSSQQARPQYGNFSYRASQHGTRPTSHPRQNQPFIPGTPGNGNGTMMYPTLLFQPAMSIPQTAYQQPRSQGYYQYIAPYIGYPNTPPSHTPYYFPSGSQQMPTQSMPANGGGRGSGAAMVGPPAAPAAAPAAVAHPAQPQPHIHQQMPGMRPQPPPKRSRAVPIINPLTQQDIFMESDSNENQEKSGESSERQTPQPEPPTNSIAEEFVRMVNEAAKQPSESNNKTNYSTAKIVDTPTTVAPTTVISSQSNAIMPIVNNNIVKSDILTVNETKENKTLGPDVAAEPCETPVVSAISDSPVIVPKLLTSMKQQQKNSEQNVLPVIVDSNKIIPLKPHKQIKSKPVVPKVDDVEKAPEEQSLPEPVPALEAAAPVVTAPYAVSSAPPQPQRVPKERAKPEKIREPEMEREDFAPAFAKSSSPVFVPAKSSLAALEPAFAQVANTPASDSLAPASISPSPSPAVAPSPPLAPAPAPTPDAAEAVEKRNGPVNPVEISSEDSLTEIINTSTSQNNSLIESLTKEREKKQSSPVSEVKPVVQTKAESVKKTEPTVTKALIPTATELLAASIEKIAKEVPLPTITETEVHEECVTEAQAKLTQSLSSCLRSSQPETKMKDINPMQITDADAANGNSTESDSTKVEITEDINKNEKSVKNSKNMNNKAGNTASSEALVEAETRENGKNETDIVEPEEVEPKAKEPEEPIDDKIDDKTTVEEETDTGPPAPAVFVPKYKYSDDQWSPLNTTGKKTYDIGLLKQIKDDPMSKNKPDAPLLEACCKIMRSTPTQEALLFTSISRPINDALFPSFAKGSGSNVARGFPREQKKDGGRSMNSSAKSSMKMGSSSSMSGPNKSVIVVNLRENVKLNETENAWKPSRFKKDEAGEDESKTQELYLKFRGILNKLTPQKFETLLEKVKTLDINNQKRLEGVIDLVFEKAIEEPNFSEAYANMCSKLSTLKVPADNATSNDKCVNFRGLIISKCQNQFVAEKTDEAVLKYEKELSECKDPVKRKELTALLEEENRRVRMRSVGNVRFIGELYKLKMLTAKIMAYCMNHLVEKLEEEKLECLCKLLTTIGEQVEGEVRESLDNVFKKMQDIVDRKSNKISSRVRFMLQDVIELRRRRWVGKSVVDSQPKMMDQIQKEAEQQQRQIELMNSVPMGGGGGGFRRDGDGRGKRGGDGRRQGSNSYQDNNWKTQRAPTYNVDVSKLKNVNKNTNIGNITLGPHSAVWNHGSGTKNTAKAASNSITSLPTTTTNMYSMLADNMPAELISSRGNKDVVHGFHSKGASIERSTFNPRGDFTSSNRSSLTTSTPRSISSSRSTSGAPNAAGAAPAPSATPAPAAPPAVAAPAPAQIPLTDAKRKSAKAMIELCLINPDDNELISEIKHHFEPQYHASLVAEILNVAFEKSAKDILSIGKSLLHIVSTNTISPANFLGGLSETFEFAPDLYIDIPMLYEYLGKYVAPHIEKKHFTIADILKLSQTIITSNHGHLLLRSIFKELKESMGPTFVKSKWQESGLAMKQWMSEDQVAKFIADNKLEFLEDGAKASEDTKKILTPAETQSKLLQLMNSEESCDCIKGWVQDNIGKCSNEDWFMRALVQAICEHALFGAEGRDVPHFNQNRMSKYANLINEYGESKQARAASCLLGIQQLIHRLEHPQGVTLDIFQYLHDQCIISVEGFFAWEESKKELEGKAVIVKALTSFFINLKEADNEDSCSED